MNYKKLELINILTIGNNNIYYVIMLNKLINLKILTFFDNTNKNLFDYYETFV